MKKQTQRTDEVNSAPLDQRVTVLIDQNLRDQLEQKRRKLSAETGLNISTSQAAAALLRRALAG